MKHILLAACAVAILSGCGSQGKQAAPTAEMCIRDSRKSIPFGVHNSLPGSSFRPNQDGTLQTRLFAGHGRTTERD